MPADLLHNELTFHATMAKTTRMPAAERVGAGRLRDKFNCGGFSLLEQPAVLRRSKNKPLLTARFSAIGIRDDFEAMIVVDGSDLELNFDPGLHMNRRRIRFVLLSFQLDHLSLLSLRHDWAGLQAVESQDRRKPG